MTFEEWWEDYGIEKNDILRDLKLSYYDLAKDAWAAGYICPKCGRDLRLPVCPDCGTYEKRNL